jgi:hypothetical protein
VLERNATNVLRRAHSKLRHNYADITLPIQKRPAKAGLNGRYWARTSDPQLVELVLSQLS